jgi:superfamily I DNA/RNA helicase
METRNWSEQQEAIFGWFANADRPARYTGDEAPSNLVVVARAGTGKTTTIIEGINRAPETNILLCAFNKRIAEELTNRISNPNAKAQTLHSIGFAAVRRYWSGLRVCSNGERADGLAEKVCGIKTPDVVKRLVSKLHSKAREINPHARNVGDITDLLYAFECEPDETWQAAGYDAAFVERKSLEAMELAATVKPVQTGIDFADMIFLPVRNGWLAKQFDLVVVDEAQDMTVAQLEIAQGISKGRIAVVGDDRQAIYGFRGADSNSLSRLKTELNAVELKLTVTYRCGQNIVAEARNLVNDFECGASHEGVVDSLNIDAMLKDISNGDFLLSRTNAPLVSTAFALIRSGKRARIAGRDIGAGLKAIVRKLNRGHIGIETMIERIEAWREREVRRFAVAKREAQIEQTNDKAETLLVVAHESKSVADMESRIDGLFTDDGLGQAGIITCSSVHRSKGLEANRVFVLEFTLKGGNIEEENIQYVAVTRAKNHLTMVYKNEEGA